MLGSFVSRILAKCTGGITGLGVGPIGSWLLLIVIYAVIGNGSNMRWS